MAVVRDLVRGLTRDLIRGPTDLSGVQIPVLTLIEDGLEEAIPFYSMSSSASGTLYWDFHSSATPPAAGAGDHLTGTQAISSGITVWDTDLSAAAGETGYLHYRVTNSAGTSNILTSQVITVSSSTIPYEDITMITFTPLNNQPPATNFATLDTRNSIAVLDFDDGATNEEAVFVGFIPSGSNLTSGIKVRIAWMATSATTGQVRWGAQFEKYGTDMDADSFDTATEAHTATSGTSGIPVITEITCTTIDSLAAGDMFRLKIYRDSSDTTNDTMTGDAELIAVNVVQVA